jgi:hypothetical protein
MKVYPNNMDEKYKSMSDFILNFELHKKNDMVKRCAYVHGPAGCGKTTFVLETMRALGYDCVVYNAGDVRNKTIIESIQQNMSATNISSMFTKKKLKIAIVMDEIECMNNGDKSAINTLIKLVRPKKTKKQKLDPTSYIPIICVGNNTFDKKIKELLKCCHVIELQKPCADLMLSIAVAQLPNHTKMHKSIVKSAGGDLRKLVSICDIMRYNKTGQNDKELLSMFELAVVLNEPKTITKNIINTSFSVDMHTNMNDTERTIVSLLFHENIIDVLEQMPRTTALPLYMNILENMCFSDYIDRLTFQKQIWQFNEMSSLIKTFHSAYLLSTHPHASISDIRFTKILTKYSTEYNNSIFSTRLSQELGMDKRDVKAYLWSLLAKKKTHSEICAELNCENIKTIDVNRFFRLFV